MYELRKGLRYRNAMEHEESRKAQQQLNRTYLSRFGVYPSGDCCVIPACHFYNMLRKSGKTHNQAMGSLR